MTPELVLAFGKAIAWSFAGFGACAVGVAAILGIVFLFKEGCL